jgi:hypothetical protein
MEMKINRVVHKHYISILFFIILLIIACIGLFDIGTAAADTVTKGSSHTTKSISDLMASMNMLELSEVKAPPDFSLMSVAEEKINLRQHQGKVVLLSFWATW